MQEKLKYHNSLFLLFPANFNNDWLIDSNINNLEASYIKFKTILRLYN